MADSLVLHRRRWFQHFPYGTIEFLLVTRVLVLILLLTLGIVTSIERAAVLVAVTGLIWLDYALTLWWFLQMLTDRQGLSAAGTGPEPATSRRSMMGVFVPAILPSVFAGLALAPWADFLQMVRPGVIQPTTATGVLLPILLVGYGISAVVAWRVLVGVAGGHGPAWALMLIPLVHWLGLHRLLRAWERDLTAESKSAAGARQATPGGNPAATLADVFWFLGVLPWILIAVSTLWRGQFPGPVIPLCGATLSTAFAVAELAALEHVQRVWLHRLEQHRPS